MCLIAPDTVRLCCSQLSPTWLPSIQNSPTPSHPSHPYPIHSPTWLPSASPQHSAPRKSLPSSKSKRRDPGERGGHPQPPSVQTLGDQHPPNVQAWGDDQPPSVQTWEDHHPPGVQTSGLTVNGPNHNQNDATNNRNDANHNQNDVSQSDSRTATNRAFDLIDTNRCSRCLIVSISLPLYLTCLAASLPLLSTSQSHCNVASCLSTSLSRCPTIALPHWLSISLPYHLAAPLALCTASLSLPHCLTGSLSLCTASLSLPHCLTGSLSHCCSISLPLCLTAALSHWLSVSLPLWLTGLPYLCLSGLAALPLCLL